MRSQEGYELRSPTSAVHDVYEVMFQAADMASAFWQPVLKGAGRWQLEMAHLAAKQTRAGLALGHRMARTTSPQGLLEAYHDYWGEIGSFYTDASRNIATALVRAVPHAAVLELPVTPRRRHDTLDLIDDDGRRAA